MLALCGRQVDNEIDSLPLSLEADDVQELRAALAPALFVCARERLCAPAAGAGLQQYSTHGVARANKCSARREYKQWTVYVHKWVPNAGAPAQNTRNCTAPCRCCASAVLVVVAADQRAEACATATRGGSCNIRVCTIEMLEHQRQYWKTKPSMNAP